MKNVLLPILVVFSLSAFSQKRINPIIKNYGTIFDIPFAEEKPDPDLAYNIIVEIEKESDRPDSVSWALNNVARLINQIGRASCRERV